MATRTAKAATGTMPTPDDAAAQPPGAVETAIAAATMALLPAPARDDEAVRRLAYAFYEERGRADGHDLEDWLKAEAALGSADPGR